MKHVEAAHDPALMGRVEELFREAYGNVLDFTAGIFQVLLFLQWAAAMALAAWITPFAWFGATRGLHGHLALAFLLGAALTLPPVYLLRRFPRSTVTRVVVVIAQMCWAALLIHLTGGRIETHFHIFGSLALIAFYRDTRLLAPATIVVTLDHAVRGLYWPESVYGVSNPEWWRFLEHAGWVAFLDVFLFVHCRFAYRELREMCWARARVEDALEATRYTFELERARDAAEAAAQHNAAFLASMSHEIRTPMNAVMGMTSLLADTDLDQHQRELVKTVETSGDHLMMLINDILDLSKIEAEKVQLEERPFSLRKGLEDCFDMIGRDRLSQGVDLNLDVAEHLPESLIGDVGRVRQVVVNLVSNAIKFTESGEVAVRADGAEVGEGVWRLELTVRDTGMGIDPRRLPYLFDPFTQADSGVSRTHGGTGLGLAICRGLAHAMGGAVTAESTPGEGSTFTVTLQVRADDRELAPRELAPSLAGQRVLIVDDSETNRRILRSFLEARGLEVHAAPGPREALELVDSGLCFSLALLDFQMPELDGVGLREELASRVPEMPCVLLTSDPARAYARGAERAFSQVLTKPARRDRIDELLTQQLTAAPAPPPVAPEPPPPPAESEEVAGLRILLAEDNVTNQRVATLQLKRLGVPPSNIDVVSDGHAAVVAVAKGSYDLVLMDVQMPGMDGLEATRILREGFQWSASLERRPWIVALTADVVGEARDRCEAAGMDTFLEKPLRREPLREVLEVALAGPPLDEARPHPCPPPSLNEAVSLFSAS